MKLRLLLILILICFKINGQSLSLDSTFGDNGRIVDASLQSSPINIYFENNNYFLIGYSNAMASLNYDGSKNVSFGNDGLLSFNGVNENFIITGSKFSNGHFYIFGQIVSSDTRISKDIFIVKIATTGILDSGFGKNGIVRQDFGGDEILNDILILEDGKILGIGNKYVTDQAILLTKYKSNGAPDISFDPSGYKLLPVNEGFTSYGVNLFNFENNVLVVAKSSYKESGGSIQGLILMKIDENGSFISAFGTNGVKKVAISSSSDTATYTVFNASLINANELYFGLHLGYSFNTQSNTLEKYNFNQNSITKVSGLPSFSPFYKIDNSQKIYISGTERCSPATASNCSRDFNLYKKDADGIPDNTFNGNGSYSYNFFPSHLISDDKSSVVYLHNDGKIVLAGNVYNPYSTNGTGLGIVRLVDGPLSTKKLKKNRFSVYPNPVGEEFTISNPDNQHILELKIFDIYGKQIQKQRGSLTTLKTQDLEAGIYFLSIKAEEGETTLKFIKN